MQKKSSSPAAPSFSHRARAEGRIHEMNWLDKVAYVWKYLAAPDWQASPELERHFLRQQEVWAWLRTHQAPAPAARLGFFGDLMWIRRGWGSFLSAGMRTYLNSLDGLVGNLETVVSPRLPVNEWLPDLLRFNSDPRLLTNFKDSHGRSQLAALSFANNHCLDHGREAALDTLALLDSLKIPHSGLSAGEGEKRWTEFRRGDLRFGFYAATFGLNHDEWLEGTGLHLNRVKGLAPDREGNEPDWSEAQRALEEMKDSGVDIKIVMLHWGHEFELYPTDRQRTAARNLVTAGADIIVGSHPHVPQPAEVFFVNGYGEDLPGFAAFADLEASGNLLRGPPGPPRKALALYSLGNFATAMFTFLCRLSQIKEICFYQGKHGADWSPPLTQLFYNQSHRGGRRLQTLAEFAESREGQKSTNLSTLSALAQHLGEPELTAAVRDLWR